MSYSLSVWAGRSRTRNCRNSLTPSRVRREALAARLDKQWCELRCHATIEKDSEKLLRLAAELGKPREIVSPGVVQVVIQKDGRKQAELERPAGLELLDDLPGGEVLFMGVGADEVEIELVGEGFGQKIAAAGK